MASVTNELLYEILKKIQGDTAELKLAAHRHDARFDAVEQHIAALYVTVTNSSQEMTDFRARLERVERRLGLADDLD